MKLRFQDTLEIVRNFTDDQEKYQKLRGWFKTNRFTIEYLFSNAFPRYFSRINDYNMKCKLAFENQLNYYNAQKNSAIWQQEKPTQKNDSYTSLPTPTIGEPVVDFVETEIVKIETTLPSPTVMPTPVINKAKKRKNDENKRKNEKRKRLSL